MPRTKPVEESKFATWAQLAAMDFEPMDMSDVKLPTNRMGKMANPYLITVRIASIMLTKIKPELTKVLDEMDDDLGDDTFKRFRNAIAFFEGYLSLLQMAETRILCAGAMLMVDQEEEEQ